MALIYPQEQFIAFYMYVGRSERCTLVYFMGLMIFPRGKVNKQEVVEALNRTRLKLTYKVKTFLHWLQVNNLRCRQIILVSGLRFSR